MTRMTSSRLVLALGAMLVFASSEVAAADGPAAADAAQNSGNTVTLPGTNLPGGRNNLTPEQMKSIMAYRYLQSRGSGQVKRGMPQFIPFGFGNAAQGVLPQQQAGGADPNAAPASDHDAKKEAARQKRIEALKATAEKKKAAREARASQRKAQQGQDPVAVGGN